MLTAITNYLQRAASIRELSALSDRQLADLGISRFDIKDAVLKAEAGRQRVATAASAPSRHAAEPAGTLA